MIVIPPVPLTQPNFSRASTATYIDTDGVLKTAGVNVLRPKYVGSVLSGVLIEPAATNYVYHGTVLENASWTKTAVTVSANAALAPDVTMTADRLIEGTVGVTAHYIDQSVGMPAGGRIVSICASAVGARTLIIQVGSSGTVWTGTFDLVNGVVIPSVGAVYTDAPATIERVGTSAFYRCAIWLNQPLTLSNYYFVIGTATGVRDYTGNGTSGLYLWGAQVELAAVPGPPSSVIPTVLAASVLRAADAFATSGSDILYSTATETAPDWVSGGTYVLGDIRVRPALRRRYSALIGHTGSAVAPELDKTKWKDIGAINPLAMFDAGRNNQTVGPVGKRLTASVRHIGRGNALFLARLEANSGTVVVTDVGGVEVYRRALTLTRRRTTSMTTYCFGGFMQVESVMLTDLPMLAGATITVELDNGALAAKCAAFVIGRSVYVGDAEWGAISDPLVFSVIERDEFGNAELIPRRILPGLSQTLEAPKGQLPAVLRLRDEANARPVVWALGEGTSADDPWFDFFLYYGIYTRFKVVILNAKKIRLDIEISEL